MKTWSADLPFFPAQELQCRCCKTILLDIRFAVALPTLRLDWGKGLSLNSCCRCPTHNAAVGGHPRSFHLTINPAWPAEGAMAADVRWWDWKPDFRLEFARFAWARGWSVGLHDRFCHIDRRKDIGLMQTSFLYGEWAQGFTPADVMS